MRKLLTFMLLIILTSIIISFTEAKQQKEFTFRLTETEANDIINALSFSETLSANKSTALIIKLRTQSNDSTLNPKPKVNAKRDSSVNKR